MSTEISEVYSVNHLIQKLIEFRDQRDWKQFHNPKDLAISLVLEASELLENFQWKSSEQAVREKSKGIEEEMADVFTYLLLLSNEMGIDLEQAVIDKVAKNAEKYPESKSFGSNKKYTEL
ncbi:MAG: nucleotide pyrophosphohydrolase [Desulfotomaculaceae bacterium]|nr:nucleotide pyrophosphohydrolase [Desulfotomaculaceae bacterium]